MLGLKRKKNENGEVEWIEVGGAGCPHCRTNADHVMELQTYEAELENVHAGKFQLLVKPTRFDARARNRQYFKCTACGMTHYQTAMDMLRPEFKCGACGTKQTQTEVFYRQRLDKLYAKTITMLGHYHRLKVMRHECDQGHVWKATAEQMLNGGGCKLCGTNRLGGIARLTITYRNKHFLLRNRNEERALHTLAKQDGVKGYAWIKTSFSYPIPILYGSASPALYHKNSKIIVDVFRRDKLSQRLVRIKKSWERAEELGLRYAVYVVDAKHVGVITGTAQLSKLFAE